MKNKANYNTIPVGQLGIIALPGCEELATKIDHYLKKWRYERNSEQKRTLTSLISPSPASVRVKARLLSSRPSEATTSSSSAIASTTV